MMPAPSCAYCKHTGRQHGPEAWRAGPRSRCSELTGQRCVSSDADCRVDVQRCLET
ncbi:hypothetical protein BD310DRAFT_916675 [Dichomitus squalens]|uniref:Uncharacterized protein n=1 Tax=Dichomitus squalens TaxID=114155 RepID=A0A4Q9Q7Q4_9APHY|nr:hypothetical protein BD310DRAFT_916675 [Dichomitus squalens]